MPEAILCETMSTKPYLGPLTPAEVAQGMGVARGNAIRLARDALTLLEFGRWPTAASLAILSIEESGKIGLLRRVAVASTSNALNKGWKGYREHFTKLNALIGINPEGMRLASPVALQEVARPGTKLVDHIDMLKKTGFYSDCILDGDEHPRWTDPADRITENWARTAVVCAALLIRKAPISVREVELFIQHMGPSSDDGDLLSYWRRWIDAMDAEGLLDPPLDDVHNRVLDGFLGRGWRYHPF